MTAKPKPTKQRRPKRKTSKSNRSILEKQIEGVLKLLIFWRDSQQCVMQNIDGARCGNGLMWNHFIAQKQSHWLKLELGNVVCGCGNHNLLDFHGDKTLSIWFIKTFGVKAAEAMNEEARSNSGKKRTISELEEMLAHYDDLYQNRFYIDSTFDGLVRGGYYGEVIKHAIMEAEMKVNCPHCGEEVEINGAYSSGLHGTAGRPCPKCGRVIHVTQDKDKSTRVIETK